MVHQLPRRFTTAALALVIALAGGGCAPRGAGTPTGGTGGGSPETSGPTFHKDVEPILQRSCLRCHTSGGVAPFALASYADAGPRAGLIATVTQSRRMPPWGASDTDQCRPRFPWKNDPRLTDGAIATIAAWVAAGAPEGNPKDAPPPLAPPKDGLSRVDLELAPKTPFTPAAGADQYRCFVLDPGTVEARWLTGFAVVPGNPRIVHHALVFLDTDAASDKLADASGGYDCFGGPRLSTPLLVGAWAPGTPAFEVGPDVALPIPMGSRLVMQVHYHPNFGEPAPDTTRLQMQLTTRKPDYAMLILLLGNMSKQNSNGEGLQPDPDDTAGVEFRIPAGSTAHTETMRFSIPKLSARTADGGQRPLDLRLHSVGTHMHYLGTDMKVDLARAQPSDGQPASECLIETPRWNFDWQRVYSYDTPLDQLPLVRAGDTLTLRCTYDNSTDNPGLVRALADQGLRAPHDVVLGEGTLDEMCLAAGAVIASGADLDLDAVIRGNAPDGGSSDDAAAPSDARDAGASP